MPNRFWITTGILAALATAALLFWPGRNTAHHRAVASSTLPNKQPALLAAARVTETPHYRIHSTASPNQTAQVAHAVEALHERYTEVFPANNGRTARLALVLYRDRAEFKRNNHSRPWAEAYYLPPRSYAYFDASARNPYHWMLHEATHQLMREVSNFPRAKWIDEGVASYFGASRLANGALHLGDPDPDAYPIWWLPQYRLSGVLEDDLASGLIIPLDQLIGGRGGPDPNRYFNQYYIHYWSLTHFLFHYRGGRYAQPFKQLIAEGGSLENFTRLIGPPDRIQQEWYEHLLRLLPSSSIAPQETTVPYRRSQ